MRRKLLLLLLAGLAAGPIAAQMKKPVNQPDRSVELGRRLFEQRCPVCHTYVTITANKTWGPVLYDELVIGNEDRMKRAITDGVRGRMPAFKYGLMPSEIDALIEFLKTAPRARPGKGSAQAEGSSDE